MDIAILLPFLVLIGAMLLMTRSAKNKQRQAMAMRDSMEPGTGIRTIGGMYARVKEVHDDIVLLEVAPGVHATYAKNAVGAVLEDEEYERIINGDVEDDDTLVVPDDASSLTGEDEITDGERTTDLSKGGAAAPQRGEEAATDSAPVDEEQTEAPEDEAQSKDASSSDAADSAQDSPKKDDDTK